MSSSKSLKKSTANNQEKNESTGKMARPKMPELVKVSYTSLPVDIPPKFLAPLSDPSDITFTPVDFKNSTIPEYDGLFAVVLDGVLTAEECESLIKMAEMSAGGHRAADADADAEGEKEGEEKPKSDNGWVPAMVNGGSGREYAMLDYRNSDRIIWDEKTLAKRLWTRCLQAEGLKEQLQKLNGQGKHGGKYDPVLGSRRGRNWKISDQGLNERLRFLRYGKGQYFREHCDGQYTTPDGKQTSFYTLHLYLNDSLQVLSPPSSSNTISPDAKPSIEDFDRPVCVGGATTFHSPSLQRSLDVDPKAGRVLIFQQNRLFHSGADVVGGQKYTMRSDLMYEIC
ncbi:hypothetical protein BP6252_11748 [Coleophoma cylindrospora]|uniref:Prolyl 4-hydroxylase alpha subunit domain-containing protein n=1 Tax=Coleophoma cylindrospora TaxID=1849047 RepID=A0A3D8QKI2_9HELO|nr:hypothetical protein BP6252_11748 [Coleophoma cylindrospora]